MSLWGSERETHVQHTQGLHPGSQQKDAGVAPGSHKYLT